MAAFKSSNTWNIKKKLIPKTTDDPPAAKIDRNGTLITGKKEIEKLLIETFQTRLSPNEMSQELKETEKLKEFLFQLRYEEAKGKQTESWNMIDLQRVLNYLPNNKARDAHGHVFELFKNGGSALKSSLLKMANFIKKKQEYPSFLTLSNISPIYKGKGSRLDPNNLRGVFNVVKVKSIVDRLIYNEKYETIDDRMSSSNIGGRKGRNIRDHLFVLNAILYDKLKKQPMSLQI